MELNIDNNDKKYESDDNTNDINNYDNNINYPELEKIRKTIENLNNNHHIEIAKILKNNNIKLTENNNGIFLNLNNISESIINEIKNYISFIKSQENLINIDETKKENIENIYFKDKSDLIEESNI